MLDLSTPKSCQSNGVNYDFLMNKELEWRMVNTIFGTKSYSQYIGESAYEKGFEGILYESSKESESKKRPTRRHIFFSKKDVFCVMFKFLISFLFIS